MGRQNAMPPRQIVDRVVRSVVQVVALKRSWVGNYSPAWTGSGTMVDSRGLVLTNCHVANPRAMGMPAPAADVIAIAVTNRTDEPPALTYLCELVVYSPELDLAVLRIVADINGNRLNNLNVPYIPLSNSDELELGDTLSIFGYPGIGGKTITFTSGAVSGFTSEEGVQARRAWIKTDATIAGGNSGGTAVNENGELVGVPTQAAAGSNIVPVDARPVVDTNQDGRVDQNDSPMTIGGFINGLRPINLALPLLRKAGMNVDAKQDHGQYQQAPSVPLPQAQPKNSGPRFGNLLFSTQVTDDGRPINPTTNLMSGANQLFASFEFSGLQNGLPFTQVWAVNGQKVVENTTEWEDGESGRKTIVLGNQSGLPDGKYHVVLALGQQIMAEGEASVGRHESDTDTQINGKIVDHLTGQGIADALIIVLRPDASVQQFLATQARELAFTSARTDANGAFALPTQLPKGHAYGLVIVARGYEDLTLDGALQVSPDAGEQAEIGPIPLARE